MDRGESQTVFFERVSASVMFACVHGLMKWRFCFFFFSFSFSTELANLKLPAALQNYFFSFFFFFGLPVLLLRGEMGVRGRSERLK